MSVTVRIRDIQAAAEVLRDRVCEIAIDQQTGDVSDTLSAALGALDAAVRLLELATKETS